MAEMENPASMSVLDGADSNIAGCEGGIDNTANNNVQADGIAAAEFLAGLFKHTTHPVYLCSLANVKNDPNTGPEKRIMTRDAAEIATFVTKNNDPLRATYFCVGTVEGWKRNKDFVRELPALWADIDFKDTDEKPADIMRKVKAMRLPPSIIVASGHGYHCYWTFREPVPVVEIQRIEAAAKLLADLVAGDMQVTQIAALMRVPGSNNTKVANDWRAVAITGNGGCTYEFDDIEEMLSETSPFILRKVREKEHTIKESNFFTEYGTRTGHTPPLDVKKRLGNMMFMGSGDASIHITQLQVTASMLNDGIELEQVVSLVLETTKIAAGTYGQSWNWKREENTIRGMCATWLKKHPTGETKNAKEKVAERQEKVEREKRQADAVVDWDKVPGNKDWLTVVADLPKDAGHAAKIIVGHVGGLAPLVVDFKQAGLRKNKKPFGNWTEVQAELALALLAADGITNEKVAAALLCPLVCNRDFKSLTEAQMRVAVERAIRSATDEIAQEKKDAEAAGKPSTDNNEVHHPRALGLLYLAKERLHTSQFRSIPDGHDAETRTWFKFKTHIGLWAALPVANVKEDIAEDLQEILKVNHADNKASNKVINEGIGFIMRTGRLKQANPVEWDNHGKVAVNNGLIDPITLEIEPIRKEHYATRRINVDYDRTATCEIFLRLLHDMFQNMKDEDRATTIELIQEAIGLAMIANKPKALRALFVFFGLGDTGKSELLAIIGGFLSDNPITTPLKQLESTHGTAAFLNSSVVWILTEAFSPDEWHYSELLKEIIGGEAIQVNPKNQPARTIIPNVSAFFGTNYPSQFKDSSATMAARTIIIETMHAFDKNNPVGVAAEARLRNPAWKPSDLILNDERPGILNFALAGLKRALERGKFVNTLSGERLLEEVRDEANLVKSFVKDCFHLDVTVAISTPDFNAAFAGYWEENNGDDRGHRCPGPKVVGRHLKALGHPLIAINKDKFRTEDGLRYYVGIRLNREGQAFWSASTSALAQADRLGSSRVSESIAGTVKPVTLQSWKDTPEVVRISANRMVMNKKASKGTKFPEPDD